MKRFVLAGIALSITACVDVPGTGSLDEDINGPTSDASAWQRLRTVAAPGGPDGAKCTATKIAANFVLSASHCGYWEGETLVFYGTSPVGSPWPTTQTAKIVHVYLPPGIDGSNSADKQDTSGLMDDLAVLEMDTFDTYGQAATLAWTYPGAQVTGQKVGCGMHNDSPIEDSPNPDGILLQVDDETSSTDDNDGQFWTDNVRVNHGDSGGPFYVGGRELGVVHDFWPAEGAIYTSVALHLDWILTQIRYHWSGAPPVTSKYDGTVLESFGWKTEQVCQYACDSRSDCQAYDYSPGPLQCSLLGTITGTSYDGVTHGALHYAGARASRTGDVVGYVRSDGVDAIVHRSTDGHVHQLGRWGNVWSEQDISVGVPSAPAPAPSSKLTAYRRGDGTNAVVYRSGNKLVEIALVGGVWQWEFFPIAAGSEPLGDPAAYVRADGLSAVVYRASNNHIIEVSETGTPAWTARDLNVSIFGAPAAASDPTAYVRSDGYSSVVYRSTNNQIFELFMTPQHTWDWGEPSALASAPPAYGKPAGYSHHDGWNAIVYSTTGGRVEELWLDSFGWHAGDITGNGAAAFDDPVPYVRTDGIESVLHLASSRYLWGQIWESANVAPWTAYNLSAYGTGSVLTEPAPFISHDGYNIVALGGLSNHASELYYSIGSSWGFADLTQWTGETP